jgi:hypothetical protein
MEDILRNVYSKLGGGASRFASHALNDIGHVDTIRHDAAHVVFHQLRGDTLFLEFLRGRIFFQYLLPEFAMLHVDAGMQFIKF